MNFDKSENYRKYVIKICLLDYEGYSVWGTDMADGENDKLLVVDGKMILFSTIGNLNDHIRNISHPYKDILNFSKWVEEENLNNVYAEYDFSLLSNYTNSMLTRKEDALMLLDDINLLEDFFIQIEFLNFQRLFKERHIINLKDYIYNNFFWKADHEYKIALDEYKISKTLKDIYSTFSKSIEMEYN